MINLKDFNHQDQLYYIENFINHCNQICDRFLKKEKEKSVISSESLILKQLMND